MNPSRRNAILTLAAFPGGALILRPANAIIQDSDPDLALCWQHRGMIAAGLGKFLGDPTKRIFAVQPGQAGYVTVYGGYVDQPGQALISYPRFPDTPPGTNYVLGGTALVIGGLVATGPWAAAAILLGTAAGGQGAAMGASAAQNPPVAVTVHSPLVEGVSRSIGMSGAWVIQFIRQPQNQGDPQYGNGDGPFGPFDPSQMPACVRCDSWLPGGRQAGDIEVGDLILLEDGTYGRVTYSERKVRPGFELVTSSAALDCSDTAPIWTPDGWVKAPDTLGKWVKTDDGVERVERLDSLGPIEIQHITVGNCAFWAGKRRGRYILHHNTKEE